MRVLLVDTENIATWEHRQPLPELYRKALDELVDPEDPTAMKEKIQQYVDGNISLYDAEMNYGWRNVPPLILIDAPRLFEEAFLVYDGSKRRITARTAGLPHVGGILIEDDADIEFLKKLGEYNTDLSGYGYKSLAQQTKVMHDFACSLQIHPHINS